MKIAVLGTGAVGQMLAQKLASLGHEVCIGTRNVEASLAKEHDNPSGGKSVSEFLTANKNIALLTHANAANGAELIVLATKGDGAVETLRQAGDITNKTVLDITNPLDFSKGFPPSLFTANTSSLAEELQAAFPQTHFIKSLNTMWNGLMVNPRMIAEDHTVFVSGNNAAAKTVVKELLKSFGWREGEILDLGDITTSRGTEAYLLLWTRIYGATQNGAFNIKIAKAVG